MGDVFAGTLTASEFDDLWRQAEAFSEEMKGGAVSLPRVLVPSGRHRSVTEILDGWGRLKWRDLRVDEFAGITGFEPTLIVQLIKSGSLIQSRIRRVQADPILRIHEWGQLCPSMGVPVVTEPGKVKVHVVAYGRKFLYMRYADPLTGKVITKSTEKTTREEAATVAAEWELSLNTGKFKPSSQVTWKEFCERYWRDGVGDKKWATKEKLKSAFKYVDDLLRIRMLQELDTEAIELLRTRMTKDKGLSVNTAFSIIASLKSVLNWALTQGLIGELPDISGRGVQG